MGSSPEISTEIQCIANSSNWNHRQVFRDLGIRAQNSFFLLYITSRWQFTFPPPFSFLLLHLPQKAETTVWHAAGVQVAFKKDAV